MSSLVTKMAGAVGIIPRQAFCIAVLHRSFDYFLAAPFFRRAAFDTLKDTRNEPP
jgi:hypothetical protein